MSDNKEWDEIVSWLQSLSYGNYAVLFKNGGYDLWEIMYDLSVDDLKDIGIKPGHAKRIEKQLSIQKESRNANNNPNMITHKGETVKEHSKSSSPSSSSIPSSPNKTKTETNTNTNHTIKSNHKSIETQQKQQQQQQQQQIAHAHQIQQLQIEERKRKIRERFQQNALFAGGIKNKLFETMTRVLNGLQQELIQYNGKFAEPINEMNQRIVALQKLDVHNLDGIWDSNDGLFEPMMRNVKDIKKFNNSMWGKINEFHNLAESQIKQSMKQLQQQINVINQMKTQYLIKQQHINALKRQFVQQQQQQQHKYKQPPMNTIVVNTNHNKDESAKPLVSNVKFTNISNNQFNYAALNNILPQLNANQSAIIMKKKSMNGDIANSAKEILMEKKSKRNRTRSSVGRKPAYTSGELQMMKNYDKKRQTVADIIELQRKMQSIYGIPRSAYGIAQKMYRMGVLSATLPKKLQALQDKPDADKIKIGDGIMNVRKPRGKPRKTQTNKNSNSALPSLTNSRSVSPSDYYTSNDDDGSSSSTESDDISSNTDSDSDHPQNNNNNTKTNNAAFQNLIIAQPAPNANANAMIPTQSTSISARSNGTTSSLLFNIDYHQRQDALVPQRKPPSTNLRRYTQEEVYFIRKLIEEDANLEAKTLFAKFRGRFSIWKDDTESYTKFYQKKWRLCKEKEGTLSCSPNLKRKRSVSSPAPSGYSGSAQPNVQQPPIKKLKLINDNINTNNSNYSNSNNNKAFVPPFITSPKKENNDVPFDASSMPKLPFVLSNGHHGNDGAKDVTQSNKKDNASVVPLPTIAKKGNGNNETETERKDEKQQQDIKKEDIMPPPLPPPPVTNAKQNQAQK